jgi:Holliday junction DNA helicase RuvA
MVLELREKLAATTGTDVAGPVQTSPVEEDVVSALVNLGYQRAAAEKALLSAGGAEAIPAKAGEKNFDTLFREALGALSK